MKETDLERVSVMNVPESLSTGNIIFPAKTHSKTI